MDIIYSNEINDFIIKVFNYYNGKINIINNKAILNINWKQSKESITMGDCTIPNVITIYPVCIMCDYNDNELKMMIVETIVHELHHADQLLDYRLIVDMLILWRQHANHKRHLIYLLINKNYMIYLVSICILI